MGSNLRDRVAANVRKPGAEVAERTAGTLEQQIRNMQEQFAMAMPKGMEAQQLVRDALTALRRVPKLAQATPASVLGALMTCAQLGLRPNTPLGHAWVLPFWNKREKRMDAQLIIGYQGYRELAQRSGVVDTVVARPIHENDEFDLVYGIEDRIVHKPCLRGPRGKIIGYYAMVKYKSGGYTFWHMTREEVEEHRDRYAMTRTREGKVYGPWVDNFSEMALKTVFLRLAKWMPKATEQLAMATVADERIRVDLTPNEDALLSGEHPVLDMDGEPVEEDKPPAPPVVDVGEPAAEEPTAEEPTAEEGAEARPQQPTQLQTQFPPVPGSGTDDPAPQGVLNSIGRLVGAGGVSDDRTRKAVVSRMAGLARPVESTSRLTGPEAKQVLTLLSQWESAGVLTEQLAAVADAVKVDAVPAAEYGTLPRPGTKTWHAARHPQLDDTGEHVVFADVDLEGECGICQEDLAGRG